MNILLVQFATELEATIHPRLKVDYFYHDYFSFPPKMLLFVIGVKMALAFNYPFPTRIHSRTKEKMLLAFYEDLDQKPMLDW